MASPYTQRYPEEIESLKKAYKARRLSLYLGAGVSAGSGLPTWEGLVVALFMSALQDQSRRMRSVFPNYLYACSEWFLKTRREALEITARKIHLYYHGRDHEFLDDLRETLYAGLQQTENPSDQQRDQGQLRGANQTLDAVATLCEKSDSLSGISGVVNYNFDDLLERVLLPQHDVHPVWKTGQLSDGGTPIFHVHGYVPSSPPGSDVEEIVFTEEQYHRATHDAYSWSNLVQIHHMSSQVGLMIGLSLSDRNMRRLLDAVKRTPLRPENYALMKRPQWPPPTPQEFEGIHSRASELLNKFQASGIQRYEQGGIDPSEPVGQMISSLGRIDDTLQTRLLVELGIRPIWYDDHGEIPQIIEAILS
jgi:hypothetical protein